MRSKDIAKEMLSPYEIRCDLEREIQALKKELALTQRLLAEAQASAANWRYQYTQLAEAGK